MSCQEQVIFFMRNFMNRLIWSIQRCRSSVRAFECLRVPCRNRRRLRLWEVVLLWTCWSLTCNLTHFDAFDTEFGNRTLILENSQLDHIESMKSIWSHTTISNSNETWLPFDFTSWLCDMFAFGDFFFRLFCLLFSPCPTSLQLSWIGPLLVMRGVALCWLSWFLEWGANMSLTKLELLTFFVRSSTLFRCQVEKTISFIEDSCATHRCWPSGCISSTFHCHQVITGPTPHVSPRPVSRLLRPQMFPETCRSGSLLFEDASCLSIFY